MCSSSTAIYTPLGKVALRARCDNSTIRFLVEHRESELVATTADRLELCQDNEGLKFHLHLRDDESSRRVADLVESGSKRGMSLGAGFADMIYDEIKIDGSEIRMVRDARLNEISLVKFGLFGHLERRTVHIDK